MREQATHTGMQKGILQQFWSICTSQEGQCPRHGHWTPRGPAARTSPSSVTPPAQGEMGEPRSAPSEQAPYTLHPPALVLQLSWDGEGNVALQRENPPTI